MESNLAEEAKLKAKPQSGHRARLMIKRENGTRWTEVGPLVADLRVPNVNRTIPVSAGRPRGLVFVVAAWTMGFKTVLDRPVW